jgi:hypothetical protein
MRNRFPKIWSEEEASFYLWGSFFEKSPQLHERSASILARTPRPPLSPQSSPKASNQPHKPQSCPQAQHPPLKPPILPATPQPAPQAAILHAGPQPASEAPTSPHSASEPLRRLQSAAALLEGPGGLPGRPPGVPQQPKAAGLADAEPAPGTKKGPCRPLFVSSSLRLRQKARERPNWPIQLLCTGARRQQARPFEAEANLFNEWAQLRPWEKKRAGTAKVLVCVPALYCSNGWKI